MLNRFADASQQPLLVTGASSSQRIMRYGLLIFSCFTAVIALMEPAGNIHYPSSLIQNDLEMIKAIETRQFHEVMFLIDTSQSMAAKDTGQKISRLEFAKEISQFVIPNLKGKMVSLAAFTSLETPIVPATQDILFTLLSLQKLHFNEGDAAGTELDEALKGIQSHFKESSIQEAKTIILLTDGGDPVTEEERLKILQAIGDPFATNMRLIVVGIGSEKGAIIPEFAYQGKEIKVTLNSSLLKNIAARGRGQYISSEEKSAQNVATLVQAAIDKKDSTEQIHEVIRHARGKLPPPIYSSYFHFPLALAISSLILFLWIPEGKFFTIIFFLIIFTPIRSYGEDPLIYLEAGQGIRAEQNYHELLANDKDSWHQAVAMYNLGCFSLKRGDYDRALGYFEQASSIGNLSPILVSYIHLNSSVSTILLVEKMFKNKEINSAQALILLRQAQTELSLSHDADCKAAKLKGSDNCAGIESYQQVFNYLQKLAANLRAEEEYRRQQQIAVSLSPQKKALQQALNDTLSILTREQIEEGLINSLLLDLSELKKIIPNPDMEEAYQQGQEALKTFQQKKNQETLFFLRSVYQVIEQILSQKNKKTPKETLQAAIENQMNAIDLTIELKKMQITDASLKNLLLKKQDLVKETGSLFIDRVIIDQRKEYQQGFCQNEPWHSALPLYFEGYKMQLAARRELDQGTLTNAIFYQNETLDYWKLALKALDIPPSTISPSANYKEQKKVQNIVEMENEDYVKPQEKNLIKMTDKPW